MAKALNLIGQRFGRLTVIRNAKPEEKPKDKNGKPKPRTWCVCKCDCGNEIITMATSLNTGNTTSCGCYQKEKASQLKTIDLIGKKFGKLTVIGLAKRDTKLRWNCVCECGNQIIVSSNELLNRHRTTCGECYNNIYIGERFDKLVVKR